MHIERIDTPDPDTRAAISAAIDVYNDAKTGRPEPASRVAVLVRDEAGVTLGGAWCVIYYDWLHVDLMYLPAFLRGQGMGTRVMRAVEREAARQGCNGVWLDTATFQAPGFYEKLGFSKFGEIPDFLPGSGRMWLLKRPAADGPDDPGLAVMRTPSEADLAVLMGGIRAYNDTQAGEADLRWLGLLVRDAPGRPVLGGLWARMSRGWMFIELLVLPEHGRRAGLGTELMDRAEAAVREVGGRGVWLDTFSFQARPFYEKRGYAVFGEIPDYPAPHSRFLLWKRLGSSMP